MTLGRLDARALFAIFAVLAIWSLDYAIVQHAAAGPGVAVIVTAATIDVSLLSALVLYAIAVRRGRLPRWTVPVTAAAGLWFARLAFGAAVPSDAGRIALAAALTVELALLGVLLWRARRAVRAWRASRDSGEPALERLISAFDAAGLPPRLAAILSTEAAIVAAVVTGWRAPARSPSRFTAHRTNGWALYAGVFGFLTVVEASVVHLLLAAYVSPIAAWIATGLSLYGLLWLTGDVLLLRHGGVVLTERGLELRLGVRWSGRIPWSAIESVSPTAPGLVPPSALNASILGANVLVSLREPVAIRGLLGRVRSARAIALSIDEPERWLAAVAARCR